MPRSVKSAIEVLTERVLYGRNFGIICSFREAHAATRGHSLENGKDRIVGELRVGE